MVEGTVLPKGQQVPGESDVDEVVGGTMDKIEQAALDHQVVIAHKYPRSMTKFMKKLTEIAQMSRPVALEMMYSVPRGGKQLIGPSVRFAEALISCWENATATVEVIDTDKEWITAEGRFYDAETNVRLAVRVRRRITDKDGKRFNADMIGVTGAAASSIALRGAILRGIPKALWADKFEMAKKTAAGDAKSIDELRGTMMKTFAALGITETRVLNALGVQGVPDIGPDEVLTLNAWHKQLGNGESTVEDIFGSPDDDEIVAMMAKLGWNQAKQKLSIDSYKGRRNDHLAYLRDEVAKKDKITPSGAGAKQSGPQVVKKAEAKPEVQAEKSVDEPAAEKPKDEGPTSADPVQSTLKDMDF